MIAGIMGLDIPSSNGKVRARSGIRARRGKSGVADGGARGDGGCELDDRDITIKGVRVKARVSLDG
jgi:hypothetical protein